MNYFDKTLTYMLMGYGASHMVLGTIQSFFGAGPLFGINWAHLSDNPFVEYILGWAFYTVGESYLKISKLEEKIKELTEKKEDKNNWLKEITD